MNHTHTIALLGLFGKSELTSLWKFLNSPFFTAKKYLPDLFLELRDPKNWQGQSPQDIFARVFAPEPFDEHKWNKALSDLNICIREFLAVQQLFADPHLRLRADMKAFFERPDERFFQQAAKPALRNLSANGTQEITDDWQLRFQAQKLTASYPLADRMRGTGDLLQDLDDSIDHYYFISKLQLACNRASSAHVLQLEADQEKFRKLLVQTEALAAAGKSALLSIYHPLLYLLAIPGAAFDPFFALLEDLGARLERSELESVVRFALNYCIQRYTAGETAAFDWYLRVFGWAERRKVWLKAANVADFFLNDGVMFAKSKDAEGFESFLEKCRAVLPAGRKNIVVTLLRAYWHFYQAEFQVASVLLQQLNSRHPHYSLRFHSLKVRNTYEEWRRQKVTLDELERALRSFNDFLKRDRLFSKPKRQSYQDLIWFVRKMAHAPKTSSETKSQLRAELKKRQPAARDWVALKIDELP